MSLGTYLAGRGLLGLFLLPFAVTWWLLLAELWVCAEMLLVTVTGGLALLAVLRREARPADVTVMRLRWGLFQIGLKGARQ
jgi:hypothetical protein